MWHNSRKSNLEATVFIKSYFSKLQSLIISHCLAYLEYTFSCFILLVKAGASF